MRVMSLCLELQWHSLQKESDTVTTDYQISPFTTCFLNKSVVLHVGPRDVCLLGPCVLCLCSPCPVCVLVEGRIGPVSLGSGDIAIDDIQVFDGSCNAGVSSVSDPHSAQASSSNHQTNRLVKLQPEISDLIFCLLNRNHYLSIQGNYLHGQNICRPRRLHVLSEDGCRRLISGTQGLKTTHKQRQDACGRTFCLGRPHSRRCNCALALSDAFWIKRDDGHCTTFCRGAPRRCPGRHCNR